MVEQTMRAVVARSFGAPEVLCMEEVERPRAGAGEVLVRVRAAGVNPVETYVRSGAYAKLPKLPFTPGTDGAGEVAEVGSGVMGLEVGQRVYTSGSRTGTYAELVVCKERDVHRLPDALTFEQGAALGVPYATAFRALFHSGNGVAGEWLLVHGASGGVGIAAVQLARAAGLRVIGTASTAGGREEVASQGTDLVLDHSSDGYLERAREASGGRGLDLILEMLANVNLGRDLGVLAPRGRVVVVGSRGPVEVTPRDLMARDAAVVGMMLGNASAEELAEIHERLIERAEAGSISPVIAARLPLHDAARAHEQVMESGSRGKIVLLP